MGSQQFMYRYFKRYNDIENDTEKWSVNKQYVSVKQLIDLLSVSHHLIEQYIDCEIR